MIIDQSAPMCQKWLSLGSTHAQVLPPRHHHRCNSITPKCLISILHIKSLFQAHPYMYSKVCTPSCIKVPDLSSSMHQILQVHHNMKSLKVTTSCHHELHESSPTNILARIHVSAQRSLQDASALHVVGMLHSLLTNPSESMAMSHQQIHLYNIPALALLIGCP